MQRWSLALIAAATLLAGCGQEAAQGPAADPVVEVSTIRVQPEPAVRTITAVGPLEPVARVLVAAQEEGVVTAVGAREGDRVAAGQVVVELDDREVRASLAEAEAALDEAEARWQRLQSLRAEGFVAEQDFDEARVDVRIGSARVDALRTRLSFTRIPAPVAGVVIARHVEVGDLASPRSALLELAAGAGLLLRVPVSELEVVRLHAGDRAEITVDALPSLRLGGRIERIFPAADSVSRQVTVELVVEQAPPEVRYGFLARAHLVLERIPAALLLPEEAVQRGSEVQSFVWLVSDGVARMREVTVGLRLDGRAQISHGLQAGDEVVVQGMARLRDGVPVEARPLGSSG